MEYHFAREKENYEDFASGRVLYSAPGLTSFPVRLAAELYGRCRRALERQGVQGPYTLYDPCCGGGYLLTVIGFMYGESIARLCASDLDARAVEVASRNLALLSAAGLERRIGELRAMLEAYGKPSHREALDSAQRLRNRLEAGGRTMDTVCFQADIAADTERIRQHAGSAHIVITDVPYGGLVQWQSGGGMELLLSRLHAVLQGPAVVAVVADKSQKIRHEQFRRIEHLKIGKRHAAILEPL
ncbi:hypothetical protein [Paenibacillus ginsengihumi]|uniref:hypothetical protein n=1 Tax=Paenibacillus ginsengihumi TaxID=431596 RepID=UPI0003643C4E|nr:hypothetical protein [Paenibacillus ginsengihumi]